MKQGSEEEWTEVKTKHAKVYHGASESRVHLDNIRDHPRHGGVFICHTERRDQLTTKEDASYKFWDDNTSSLANGIRLGFDAIHIDPGSRILWMGCNQRELEHISNIIGSRGKIFTTGPVGKLERANICFITEDNEIQNWNRNWNPKMQELYDNRADSLFLDTNAPNQAKVLILKRAGSNFLKTNGNFVLTQTEPKWKEFNQTVMKLYKDGYAVHYINKLESRANFAYLVGSKRNK